MRLFISTLRKLARRPATWVTFGLLAVLVGLILLAISSAAGRLPQRPGSGEAPFNPLIIVTFPGAYQQILAFVVGLAGLFAVIYGAAVAGSEWTWGTFKAVVARGESRSVYLIATFFAALVLIAVGVFVAYVIDVLFGALGAVLAGVSLSGIGDPSTLGNLPAYMARGMVGIAAEAALGFGVATLARSQLAGIGFGIALFFVGQFATLFLPDYVKYLPFQLASSALDLGRGLAVGGGNSAIRVDPTEALLLLLVWLAGALIVAAGFSERAEVLG